MLCTISYMYLCHNLLIYLQFRLRPVYSQLMAPQVHTTIHQLASGHGCSSMTVILDKSKPTGSGSTQTMTEQIVTSTHFNSIMQQFQASQLHMYMYIKPIEALEKHFPGKYDLMLLCVSFDNNVHATNRP